jgi:hypothetical protein
MSYDHYLDGPCEGMSLHRNGLRVTVKDKSGREEERTETYRSEEHARQALWWERSHLYGKWTEVKS